MAHRLSAVLIGGIVAVAFAQVASAADLPRKAPVYTPPAPPPPYTWTGLYAGINGGGHIGRYNNFSSAPGQDPDGFTGRTSPSGGVFGGQIGYNWQFAPNFLLGLEGDIQWMGGKETICFGECSTGPIGIDDQLVAETKSKWLATARGRLGWISNNGDYLWYFTGGGAWQQVDITVTGFDFDTTSAPTGAVSQNHTRSGWTIGGGVETRLPWQNWTAKLEYLYVDLGTITTSGIIPLNSTPTAISIDTKVRDNIVRVGLNYKFY